MQTPPTLAHSRSALSSRTTLLSLPPSKNLSLSLKLQSAQTPCLNAAAAEAAIPNPHTAPTPRRLIAVEEAEAVVGDETPVLRRCFSPNRDLYMAVLESSPLRRRLKLPRRHHWFKHRFLADRRRLRRLPARRLPPLRLLSSVRWSRS